MMQAVQVIIERLKTNPEDFFGDLNDGRPQHVKFGELASKLDDLLTVKRDGDIHRLWYLEPEEKAALIEAYKQARRARFEAKTFHQLLTRPEKQDLAMERMTPSGKRLMQGWQGQVPLGIVAPQNMLKQATEILNNEFEKEYAKISNPRS